MSNRFDNFPTLKQVEIAIVKFKKEGFPKFDKEDTLDGYIKRIIDLIIEEIGVFPNLMTSLDREHFAIDLYRVRPVDQIQNINLFSQHSYPPSSFVKFGRCNFPNFPVFYSSNNPMTSLVEVARESGGENKRYCISKWKVNSLDKIILQSFMQLKLPDGHYFEEFQNSQRKQINIPFQNKLTEDQCNGLLKLLEFLDESFINDKDYAVSASLAHRTFYAKHQMKTDILMYPSVQTRFAGLNFAVHPNYVDNHMMIDRFYIMDLKKYDPISQKLNISIVKYGVVEKNNIHWENVHPEDNEYLRIVKEDFGSLFDTGGGFSFEEI